MFFLSVRYQNGRFGISSENMNLLEMLRSSLQEGPVHCLTHTNTRQEDMTGHIAWSKTGFEI